MRLAYPLRANECISYSHKIKDYRRINTADKKILVNNFKEFYKYIFYLQNLPHPTVSQLYMARFLSQSVSSKEPLMLQAQRGLAKSLTLQIFTVWLLLRNKNEKIVVVSATSGRAESFTKFCLTLIRTIPLLQHLTPTGDDRTSTKKFDVAGRIPDDSPSMCAFGVTGAKTGSRATFIIYDDVEIPENSDTAGKREKLLEGVRDTANLGVAGEYRESCICTPQTSESVYNTMVAEDGFNRTVIPAEYPEDISVYDGDLANYITRAIKRNPKIVGEATDKRNNMAHLITQKVKGKARYKLHYMLDTSMSDAERYPLKLQDLIVTDLEPDKASIQILYSSEKRNCLYDIKHKGFRGDNLYQPRYISDTYKDYEGIAMFIDPSGRGTDETAYCVTAQMGGKIFLLDFGGIQGGYNQDNLEELMYIAKRYKVNVVIVESNFGDGAFGELLKPVSQEIYPVKIEDERASTQKEVRIVEALEPIMMQHRLVVNKQALIRDIEKKADYSFTYQLTHITTQRGCLVHDDIIDVVGMGVFYWVKSMARNEKEVVNQHKKDELKKQLRELEEKRRKNRGGSERTKSPVDAF
jgi:hypothetical protein